MPAKSVASVKHQFLASSLMFWGPPPSWEQNHQVACTFSAFLFCVIISFFGKCMVTLFIVFTSLLFSTIWRLAHASLEQLASFIIPEKRLQWQLEFSWMNWATHSARFVLNFYYNSQCFMIWMHTIVPPFYATFLQDLCCLLEFYYCRMKKSVLII